MGVFDDEFRPQLHRKNFVDRLGVEKKLHVRGCEVCHFAVLLIMFLITLGTFDPLDSVAAVHNNLRLAYEVSQVDTFTTQDDILAYIQKFVVTTYELSSALTDANTMNSIDPVRCFDENTDDVCRMKYWSTPSRLANEPNYVDLQSVLNDQVSTLNYDQSVMRCTHDPPEANCINWAQQLNHSITTNVMGLTPEDPIIMNSRLDYPFAQVVPLAPIVWQTRSPKRPCSGFGDMYNLDVLGAGLCSPDSPCNPSQVTSFDSSKNNYYTNRLQSIFLTYEENAFYCVDRSMSVDTFMDKSWDPWATYENMTTGRLMLPQSIAGKDVFFKFISDVAYLQAPINGTTFINRIDGCYDCAGSETNSDCTDPLEYGPTHSMWSEPSLQINCSGRSKWITNYLAAQEKRSTFLDHQTNSLTVGALVITPQPDGIQDITTMVFVTWTFAQDGGISATVELSSIAETLESWRYCVYATAAIVLLYVVRVVFAFQRDYVKYGETSLGYVGDCVQGLLVLGYMTILFLIDWLPPFPDQELRNAFQENNQDAYFRAFKEILDYSETVKAVKNWGFYLVITIFLRMIHHLSFHPRLSLAVDVFLDMADDFFHFLIQFSLVYSIMAFLGHWTFAGDMFQYSTFGRSAFTLSRYFVGDFGFTNAPPESRFLVFVYMYMLVMFFMMVNFFLAIVVNSHTSVTERLKDFEAEQNVFIDVWDAVKSWFIFKFRGYPFPSDTLRYLNNVQISDACPPIEDMPAVTPEELYTHMKQGASLLLRDPPDGKKVFKSVQDASAYLSIYFYKLANSEGYILNEKDDAKTWRGTHFYGEQEENKLGIEPRLLNEPQQIISMVSKAFCAPDSKGGEVDVMDETERGDEKDLAAADAGLATADAGYVFVDNDALDEPGPDGVAWIKI